MKNCLSSWSGGKDSAYALYLAKLQGYQPIALLNMMNERGLISRSHGIPFSVLKQQAAAMSIPLYAIPSSWEEYEARFIQTLQSIQSASPYSQVVFGDIDLQAHRDWEEKVCSAAGLTAFLPLWQRDRKELVLEMLQAGFETIIVSCQSELGPDFLGKKLCTHLVQDLEARGIDPCGENGEFHTLVTNCPLFKQPVQLAIAGKIKHQDYCFLQFR
ncbi:diphthine--ammonia ligase [Flavihumibacter sp. CACIAM 22H1]|uniref:Dph6-related ATP pyrophosphatase n=1 Tax=Flavihumibacter sp. CACIAM 22H1 TaxID=1812911 RepID=UPI0025C5744B|nr:diphthine--ammonia ligase [Flavihumibacter sp. CACIAM 22H1]